MKVVPQVSQQIRPKVLESFYHLVQERSHSLKRENMGEWTKYLLLGPCTVTTDLAIVSPSRLWLVESVALEDVQVCTLALWHLEQYPLVASLPKNAHPFLLQGAMLNSHLRPPFNLIADVAINWFWALLCPFVYIVVTFEIMSTHGMRNSLAKSLQYILGLNKLSSYSSFDILVWSFVNMSLDKTS